MLRCNIRDLIIRPTRWLHCAFSVIARSEFYRRSGTPTSGGTSSVAYLCCFPTCCIARRKRTPRIPRGDWKLSHDIGFHCDVYSRAWWNYREVLDGYFFCPWNSLVCYRAVFVVTLHALCRTNTVIGKYHTPWIGKILNFLAWRAGYIEFYKLAQ